MKFTKSLLACSLLAASTGLSSLAQAESPLTGNIAFTSNYIFRGLTQTTDQTAISGGLDYANANGVYLGAWTSNVDFDGNGGGNYEIDFYGGYGFDAGPVALDVGGIFYIYPVGDQRLDFTETYVNASWKMLSGGIAYTIDKDAGGEENDIYYYVGLDFELAKGLGLGLVAGSTDFDAAGSEDYNHFHAGLSKDDFTFAVDKNDLSGNGPDDLRFSVSYSKSFDLL